MVEIDRKNILLEGIYGPNRDSPAFYSVDAFKKLIDWNPNHAIFVGDFNVVLDPKIDSLNYQGNNNPRARDSLIEKISEQGLIDIYREFHPTERKLTIDQFVMLFTLYTI